MTNQDTLQVPDQRSGVPGPRRIAFCITDLDPGGAEKALLQLVTRLDRAAWSPTVFCLGPEAALTPLIRDHQIPVYCYGARSWRSWGVFSWLKKHLRELQPELLQCFLFHGNLAGRLAGRRAGVKVIVAGHRVAEREKRWHLWLDRWTESRVDHHVCVSRGVAAHVMQNLNVPAEKITVIPNGVALPERGKAQLNLRQEFGFAENSKIVLAVGRLHPQKGFLNLLQAFQIVVASVPESCLLILGEGPQRKELENRIAELGLTGRVRVPGRRDDVLDVMRQSTVLAVSSLWEGMPNVVLEAMASELPVVTTAVEGIEDLITNGEHGLVVNRDEIKGFAAGLTAVIQDQKLAARLAAAAQTLVSTRFTWARMALQYQELYDRLID